VDNLSNSQTDVSSTHRTILSSVVDGGKGTHHPCTLILLATGQRTKVVPVREMRRLSIRCEIFSLACVHCHHEVTSTLCLLYRYVPSSWETERSLLAAFDCETRDSQRLLHGWPVYTMNNVSRKRFPSGSLVRCENCAHSYVVSYLDTENCMREKGRNGNVQDLHAVVRAGCYGVSQWTA
jgi:hypothetical protein